MSIQSQAHAPNLRWVEVPRHALSPEALQSAVDEFVTRTGSESGTREYTLLEKRANALRLLELGEVIITYEPLSRSTTLRQRERS